MANLLNPSAKSDSTTLRLSLRSPEAAKALGISERYLWSLTASGDIPCVKLGRAKLYRVSALEESLRRMEAGTFSGSSVCGKNQNLKKTPRIHAEAHSSSIKTIHYKETKDN